MITLRNKVINESLEVAKDHPFYRQLLMLKRAMLELERSKRKFESETDGALRWDRDYSFQSWEYVAIGIIDSLRKSCLLDIEDVYTEDLPYFKSEFENLEKFLSYDGKRVTNDWLEIKL